MGQIAAALFCTLDGSAERPDQWHFPYFDDAMGKAVDRHSDRCEAYLMGRVLHDQWSQYWPGNTTDEFADFINPIPKYVLSTTLESSDWEGTTVLRSLDEVRELKERTQGTIGMSGSLSTVLALLEAGVVREAGLFHAPTRGSRQRL